MRDNKNHLNGILAKTSFSVSQDPLGLMWFQVAAFLISYPGDSSHQSSLGNTELQPMGTNVGDFKNDTVSPHLTSWIVLGTVVKQHI